MDGKQVNGVLEGPYTLYGSGVSFNNNKTMEIIMGRRNEVQGVVPLYPAGRDINPPPNFNFFGPTWTKQLKSANNAGSIDYNRWSVFVKGKDNPVSAFEFMDNLLGK